MRPTDSFVQQPIRSLQTMLRVLAEDDKRLITVVPDGIYGPGTMHAISTFQRLYSLPVTGITDHTTWDLIAAKYDHALTRVGPAEPIEIIMNPGQVFILGESSPYIYLLQSMLTQLSIHNPNISQPPHNGTLDNATAASLSDFQRLSNLPETGQLDKVTWKHLVHQFTANVHHNETQHKLSPNV